MAKVAFLTIGLLKAPYGDPQVQGFVDRVAATLAEAAASDGYLGRINNEEQWSATGVALPQRFRQEEYAARGAATLSLWRDLESVIASSTAVCTPRRLPNATNGQR